MSRLTKPILKAAIQHAILGDGSGQSQMVLSRPADEAFRASLSGTAFPAGGMLSRRPGQTGTTSSATNMMGDAPGRVLGSAPSYDPKLVSINPFLNPYLDYTIDKIAEGIATAHQEWQVRQRVRGITLDSHQHHDNVLSELETHLPFQTELALEDQSDHLTRGDIIDTGLRDFQAGTTPRAAALAMLDAKSRAGISETVSGLETAGAVPTANSAAPLAAKLSAKLSGATQQGATGPVFGDVGKYQNVKGRGVLQPPGGSLFGSLFMFDAWRAVASVLVESFKRVIPAAAKLSPRGMDLATMVGGLLGKDK